jgi:hypothetical protein
MASRPRIITGIGSGMLRRTFPGACALASEPAAKQ